jgi:uroporphyrinogen-III decarboxylase
VANRAAVQRIAVPPKALYEELGWGARQRKILELAGDRVAVIGDCNTATLSFCIYFRQYQNCLFDVVDDPALVHALMEKGAEFAVERGKFNIELGLRVLRLNDSAGNNSVISPRHWREFIFPHMRDVCAELHRYHPDVRIYCHICGNILPIVRDLVETGLDCIAPLDPLGGFTCAQVREVCGARAALMGGVNTLTFASGTPAEIMEEARQCIEGAGRNGGYILGSGCMLPPATRQENLAALVAAAAKYGQYA